MDEAGDFEAGVGVADCGEVLLKAFLIFSKVINAFDYTHFGVFLDYANFMNFD